MTQRLAAGPGAELGVLPFVALVLAALLVGVSKTAVSGVATLSVALFAAVLPARESTGVLLPLLLVGDVLAVRAYRGHADRAVLLRLLPSVAAGLVLGVAFVARTSDVVMRRTIGVLLLTVAVHHGWQRARARVRSRTRAPEQGKDRQDRGRSGGAEDTPTVRQHRLRTVFFGLVAGFATMVANAGGPAMSLYLLSSGFGVLGFLGTGAWFFLIVNLVKVPFSVGLGLITADGLALDGLLALAVVVGAGVGRALVHRIDQGVFERLVLVFTALASVDLLR
ncbi:sulfite exporter TauE/SafE family protein [Streptomyces noursei]|uniref:sulfite exporter TauE/SafE family protein n=1 Tax=Streptomyces noursei TaxID=1971 RepID=UPI00167382E9|nr:sulfite exporter TauE/SafE family protein [Streptomyces noursei]MCZ1015911.1 sulfite exporter TauE/SafE family protein [Streptomyces noursei]